jgi:curved DNA-binding protein CbpA
LEQGSTVVRLCLLFTSIALALQLCFLLGTKHHPDKPGGDVDTFRTLKRAQTVLSNPKLRQQYDILGLDLDDDEVEQTNAGGAEDEDGQTTSQTIVQDIASAALTTVLQFGVRTGTLTV